MSVDTYTYTACARCQKTHQEPGARSAMLPPVGWAALHLTRRGDGPGWSVPDARSLQNIMLCPGCADAVAKFVRPAPRRQPRRCHECGEVARYRYSRGLSTHLVCSGCPEVSGWDGPWHLCDTCGDDCDPRDGFRCPACRQRVGAPEEEEEV